MNHKLVGFFFLLTAGLTFLPAASQPQGQLFSRTVIYSFEPGEEFMEAESFIALTASKDCVILVIAKGENGPFFVFRNGKKQGPFSGLKEAMDKAYEGQTGKCGKERSCGAYKPASAPEDIQAERADLEDGQGQAVQFKGKTSGPYLLVYSVQTTPDGARAYFTASTKEKSVLGCTDGRKVEFGGLPLDFKFSPDGQRAAALGQGTHNVMDQSQSSSIPPEKLAADFDLKFLYTIDGKKFGPLDKDFDENDFWYPASSNDLYFKSGGQLFRNGVPMMKVESLVPCDFYPSADGQRYALFNYENILFSDGGKFPAPLDVIVFAKSGQTMVRWITLENKKDLVVYERAI
jgi:hypothetical protein